MEAARGGNLGIAVALRLDSQLSTQPPPAKATALMHAST
jgi:hypothetical protein